MWQVWYCTRGSLPSQTRWASQFWHTTLGNGASSGVVKPISLTMLAYRSLSWLIATRVAPSALHARLPLALLANRDACRAFGAPRALTARSLSWLITTRVAPSALHARLPLALLANRDACRAFGAPRALTALSLTKHCCL